MSMMIWLCRYEKAALDKEKMEDNLKRRAPRDEGPQLPSTVRTIFNMQFLVFDNQQLLIFAVFQFGWFLQFSILVDFLG